TVVTKRKEERDDDPHRLLCVVCPVAETVRRCRAELEPFEIAFSRGLARLSGDPEDRSHEQETAGKADHRRKYHKECYLSDRCPFDGGKSCRRDSGAGKAPDQRMGRRSGKTKEPG